MAVAILLIYQPAATPVFLLGFTLSREAWFIKLDNIGFADLNHYSAVSGKHHTIDILLEDFHQDAFNLQHK